MPVFTLEIDPTANVDHEMNNVMVDGQVAGRLFSGFASNGWHWVIDRELKGNLGPKDFSGSELTREAAFEAFKVAWAKR